MTNEDHFPPKPKHETTIKLLADAFGTVIEGRSALYVSTPLTSGRRASSWDEASRKRGELTYEEFVKRFVVAPNRQVARRFVRKLRKSTNEIVISPTDLNVDGWIQDDYHSLWGIVIKEYVKATIFLDGWEFSRGCCYEYLISIQAGADTRSQDGSPLPLDIGRVLLVSAIEEERKRGVDSSFQEAVLRELHQFQLEETVP